MWGGIDRNVPRKATANPTGLQSLRPSRPRPSGAVQRPGTCTADASWHSSALCTVVALRERPNTRPFLVPSLASYQLIHSGSKWRKTCQIYVHPKVISRVFLCTFVQIYITSVSDCLCFTFEIWQMNAGTSLIRQFHEFLNIIFGGFL